MSVRSLARRLMCAAACAATACGSPSGPASPSTGASARTIVVLGDSLAVSPSRAEGFPAVLQARLGAAHPGWTVDNQGVSGDTTADGLRRVDAALKTDTAILVVELGANDVLGAVAVPSIESNLSTIIERAQSRGIRVLLCGLEIPPINTPAYAPAFNQMFPRLATKYHVALVPSLLEGVAFNPDLNGPDGVHPNAAGAVHVADTVWVYLESLVTGG